MRPSGTRRSCSRGQVLVELCLLLPFLLVLATSMLEIGVLAYVHIQLSGAAAEVTKLAWSNNYDATDLQNIFDQALGLDLSNRTFQVTTMASDPDLAGMPSATILATYNQPYIGFFQWGGRGAITLTSQMKTFVTTNGPTGGALHPD